MERKTTVRMQPPMIQEMHFDDQPVRRQRSWPLGQREKIKQMRSMKSETPPSNEKTTGTLAVDKLRIACCPSFKNCCGDCTITVEAKVI